MNHASSETLARSPHSKARRARRLAAGLLAVAAVVTVAWACWLAFAPQPESRAARNSNAELGQLAGKTDEEIQAELNRVVEEGMFDISIASDVTFANGQAEGELRIENVPGNRYLMEVELVRDDTGETLYTSGLIEPGYHIQAARLDVDLDPGEYACTAVFTALDPQSEEAVGSAAAQVRVTVAS